MEIAPASKYARIRVLNQAFDLLSDFYQQKGMVIAWAVDGNEVAISPDYLWDKYVADVDAVRNNLMYSMRWLILRNDFVCGTVIRVGCRPPGGNVLYSAPRPTCRLSPTQPPSGRLPAFRRYYR